MSLAERVKRTKIVTPGKILTLDIERLPGLAKVWEPRIRGGYVSPRNFVKWPELLCADARWYGEKDHLFTAEWDAGGHDMMVHRLWGWFDEAEIVVGYNSDRFDIPHLRTEWLRLGLQPPRPFKSVDLYKTVKTFGFESKSLDSVTRRLGRPGKQLSYDMTLAQACVDGDEKAQRKMQRYNRGDVELTEWLYDRLRPWISTHPMIGPLSAELQCNRCGSEDLDREQGTYRAVVIDYLLYRCRNCGGHVRGGWHSRAAASRGVK